MNTNITNIKEKNEFLRNNSGKIIRIIMTEDFTEDEDYAKIAGYFIKLKKGLEYDIKVTKFDEWNNGDLAVSIMFPQNILNDNNIVYKKNDTNREYYEIQPKIFTYKFDIGL